VKRVVRRGVVVIKFTREFQGTGHGTGHDYFSDDRSNSRRSIFGGKISVAALLPARHMKHALKVTAVSLAAFAIYLPVAYWVGRDFVPQPRPEGALVERLNVITHSHRYAYVAQSYGTSPYADVDLDNQKSPVVLYEDLTPLGSPHSKRTEVEDFGLGRYYHSKLEGRPDSWRFFTFSTSDNSDPRTNGRTYWAVVPR